jgi:hypothetical protein
MHPITSMSSETNCHGKASLVGSGSRASLVLTPGIGLPETIAIE